MNLSKPSPKNAADPKKTSELLTAKALKLLSFRPRSCQEIQLRLNHHYLKPSKELIEKVINNLKNKDLLNDQEFTSWWVNQRNQHRPKGRLALKAELLSKGIDKHLIDKSLPSLKQELKLAQKIIKKKQKGLKNYSSYQQKSKLITALKSRGFSYQIISRLVDAFPYKE